MFKFFFPLWTSHGHTRFVGAGYFSFILCMYICVLCVGIRCFFPHFSPLAIIIRQECTPGIMCVRYGPTQPSILHKQHNIIISILGVYSVCFPLCSVLCLAGGDASFLRSLCRLPIARTDNIIVTVKTSLPLVFPSNTLIQTITSI